MDEYNNKQNINYAPGKIYFRRSLALRIYANDERIIPAVGAFSERK